MLPDKLITTTEAAAVLALKPGTVRALAYAGKLPVVHPAATRAVRFRRSDILRAAGLRENEHGAPEQPG